MKPLFLEGEGLGIKSLDSLYKSLDRVYYMFGLLKCENIRNSFDAGGRFFTHISRIRNLAIRKLF